MSKQLTINGESLLLCERLEMARFLHVYLQYLFRQGVSLPTLQLLNYRSLEQLSSLAERLPRIVGSKQVQKVIVFADAQNDLENRRNVLLDLRSSAFFRAFHQRLWSALQHRCGQTFNLCVVLLHH